MMLGRLCSNADRLTYKLVSIPLGSVTSLYLFPCFHFCCCNKIPQPKASQGWKVPFNSQFRLQPIISRKPRHSIKQLVTSQPWSRAERNGGTYVGYLPTIPLALSTPIQSRRQVSAPMWAVYLCGLRAQYSASPLYIIQGTKPCHAVAHSRLGLST